MPSFLEAPVAGGHSARPRGRLALDGDSEPVYGPRDRIDVPKVAALGLPFWLAGAQSGPEQLVAAQAAGAAASRSARRSPCAASQASTTA